jgi:hypothetical protein
MHQLPIARDSSHLPRGLGTNRAIETNSPFRADLSSKCRWLCDGHCEFEHRRG